MPCFLCDIYLGRAQFFSNGNAASDDDAIQGRRF